MSDFKEYRSVTDFPAKAEKLTRQELIEHYKDLRNTYKNLNNSRGQLVRRQREAKGKIVNLNQDIQEKSRELKEKDGKLVVIQNQLRTTTQT